MYEKSYIQMVVTGVMNIKPALHGLTQVTEVS